MGLISGFCEKHLQEMKFLTPAIVGAQNLLPSLDVAQC